MNAYNIRTQEVMKRILFIKNLGSSYRDVKAEGFSRGRKVHSQLCSTLWKPLVKKGKIINGA